ncbi:hypothetical protein HYFRA_00002382 [Hymenoscyphus fraxineus]|uniref:Thioesterase-like superfamily-domain-containing protein n=1 Tax=Hymenoscyphus fraxineus TaxID=746836 RepID=A0A9N9PYY0_9HELO|nr:hypothetical protein HYFRA_00002382 [Hymenoscyphus fraxineus]
MDSPFDNKIFQEATLVKALSSHTYEAYFHKNWCIYSVPHGGYVTACFLQVAATHFNTTLAAQNQPHTIALHVDFLRRTEVGPALFTVKDTKIGRQASVIHIALTQNGREETLAVITNSNMDTETGATYPTTYRLNPEPITVSFDHLSRNEDKNWRRQDNMPYKQFRKALENMEFYFPRDGQKSRTCADQWVRLRRGEKWTNHSLGFLSDAWPIAVEALRHAENPYDITPEAAATRKTDSKDIGTMWYPTLLLNIDFKKSLPAKGVEWLFVRAESKQIKNGRLDVEVTIKDASGDLVAISHHVTFAVGLERNLAKRGGGGEAKI